jgi:hypothetical protein
VTVPAVGRELNDPLDGHRPVCVFAKSLKIKERKIRVVEDAVAR